jgi:hypothetical protein
LEAALLSFITEDARLLGADLPLDLHRDLVPTSVLIILLLVIRVAEIFLES